MTVQVTIARGLTAGSVSAHLRMALGSGTQEGASFPGRPLLPAFDVYDGI